MTLKNYFTLPLLLAGMALHAQTDPNKTALDSLLKDDAFARLLLDSLSPDPAKSTVDISIGFGNRLFSLNNKTLTAEQSDVRKLIITPTLSYFHKSGFGLSLSTFLGRDSNKLRVFQSAITPSYDYLSEKFAAGISYTRYFSNNSLAVSPSPFHNDFYLYGNFNKGLLQPGLAVGYANGQYKEYTDSVRVRQFPLPPLRILDTTVYKLQDLSVTASVKHNFEWYGVFSAKDGFLFSPQFMLIFGSQKYTSESNTTALRRSQTGVTRLRNSSSAIDRSGFNLESVAASLDIDYSIGKLYIRPQLYVDYYLRATDTRRLTTTFACTVGISL